MRLFLDSKGFVPRDEFLYELFSKSLCTSKSKYDKIFKK